MELVKVGVPRKHVEPSAERIKILTRHVMWHLTDTLADAIGELDPNSINHDLASIIARKTLNEVPWVVWENGVSMPSRTLYNIQGRPAYVYLSGVYGRKNVVVVLLECTLVLVTNLAPTTCLVPLKYQSYDKPWIGLEHHQESDSVVAVYLEEGNFRDLSLTLHQIMDKFDLV